MIFSEHEELSDLVIKKLLTGTYKASVLHSELVSSGHTLSRQATYDILRSLCASEVVVKHGVNFSINLLWINRLISNVSPVSSGKQTEARYLYDMKDGESVTFHFSSMEQMDKFWWNIFITLQKIQEPSIPLVIYFPHQIIYFAREKTEKEFFRDIQKHHLTLYSVGGNTELDKIFKQEVRSEKLFVNTGVLLKSKKDNYLNIQGEFVVEALPHLEFSKKVATIFKTANNKQEAVVLLQELSKKKYPIKLMIRKNKKQANLLRKQLAKDFFVPKEYSLVS